MSAGRGRSTLPWVSSHAKPGVARIAAGVVRRLVAAAALVVAVACQPGGERRAVITVGTTWSGPSGEALARELLRIGGDLRSASLSVRTFSPAGLADYLTQEQAPDGEAPIDLVIVPNDWLGRLADRGIIGELPQARVETLQDTLVRQALLAVSDRDEVLAYPISAEVLALVYDPLRFPSPPRTIDDLLRARLPAGAIPFATDVGSAYHLAPLMSSYQGSLMDARGDLVWDGNVLGATLRRLAPEWSRDSAWRAFAGDDLASLQLQLFAEGRLASFPTGPWMLEALEECGHPFAVTPMPTFADAPHHAHALVRYQCAAVLRGSRWADLALEIGARLLEPSCNERLTHASRSLPVLLGAYKTEAAMASPGVVGFLRALEGGQAFPTSSAWGEAFQRASQRLQRLAHRSTPPTAREVETLLAEGSP
jgi:maltose-binding protein MalE